jgi:hypothetical protein
MFLIPNPPGCLAPLAEWEAYRALLLAKFSEEPGVSGALADADGVIRSIKEKQKLFQLAA